MYFIDTEPPNKFSDLPHHSFPKPPAIFNVQSSPTPSSDLSTLTNSFHSVGHQFYPVNSQPQNNNSQLPVPQLNLNYDHYRHSSSSIDHKTLNLTKFNHLHQQNRAHCLASGGKYCRYHQEILSQPSRRSNSFNQQNGSETIENSIKRSSINLNSLSSSRYLSYQRHLLSPKPAPPKPPARLDSEPTSLNKNGSLETEVKMQRNNGLEPASQLQRGLATGVDAPYQHQLVHHHHQVPQQIAGTDSLDNIQMIVDEDDKDNFERFMFETSDEPNKMNTIKMARVADSMSPANKRAGSENEQIVEQ